MPAVERVDPDIDLHVPADRRELRTRAWPVLAVIACGGIAGTLARYGLQRAWPQAPGGYPWATFTVNVTGCFLIGVLMVLISQVWPGRPLVRPFLGVGVLGGFTTFSTYALDVQQAVTASAPAIGLLYLAATLVGALLAVWAGTALTTLTVRRLRG